MVLVGDFLRDALDDLVWWGMGEVRIEERVGEEGEGTDLGEGLDVGRVAGGDERVRGSSHSSVFFGEEESTVHVKGSDLSRRGGGKRKELT